MINIEKITVRLFKSDIKELYDYANDNDLHFIEVDIKSTYPDSIDYGFEGSVTLYKAEDNNLPFWTV